MVTLYIPLKHQVFSCIKTYSTQFQFGYITIVYHVTVLKQFHIFRCIESNIKICSHSVTYSLYDKSAQYFLVLALLYLLRAAGLTRLSMHQIRTCCTARWQADRTDTIHTVTVVWTSRAMKWPVTTTLAFSRPWQVTLTFLIYLYHVVNCEIRFNSKKQIRFKSTGFYFHINSAFLLFRLRSIFCVTIILLFFSQTKFLKITFYFLYLYIVYRIQEIS